MAVASLVLGIVGIVLSFVFIGIIPGIIGLILGIIATVNDRKNGIAIAGLTCSFISVLIFFCALLSSITSIKNKQENSSAVAQVTVTGSEYVAPEPTDSEPIEKESVWANEYTPINNFRYHIDEENRTITLISYDKGPDDDIHKILLSPVYTLNSEDYTLVSMGSDACFFGKTWIESVIIPEGVTYIEGNCFNSCGVKDIYLPSTLEAIPESLFSYLGDEYKVYCNSVIDLPADRDSNDYELRTYGASGAEELGESFAGAINGLVMGLGEDIDNPTVVNIYFGGTDDQWHNLTDGYDTEERSIDDPENADDSSDLYDKGKEAGDAISEKLGNIDW